MDDEIRKAIEVLTNLEASHTEKQDAAVGLANLANENDQNRVAIAAAGGIPALVALVTSSSKASKIQAASALGSLAFGNSQNKMAVAAAGGIPPLVAMVTNGSDSTKERAVAALVTLATDNAQNQVTIAAEGAIPPIVALVTNGSSSVKREAAHALTTLASDNAQNKVSIAAEGGIPPLVALVKHGSRIAKLEAAKALRNLSDENKQNCAAIAAAGGVPPLAALMTPASAASQTASAASQTATRALINMAVLDNQCCAAMASSAEVRAAIEGVAKDGTPENRDWAERLARELDSANDPVPKITGGLSVEKLKAEIQTLETGKEDQKAKGAEQLGNWAALSDENRVAITREGGAEALVGLVVTGSDDAKWHSARALRHLSNNDKAKKAIVKAGGIATLEVVVRHGKGQLKDAADEALKLLSQKDVESGSTPATKSADAKSVPAEAASAIPSGEGTRVAMFSARFDGGPVEKTFGHGCSILMFSVFLTCLFCFRRKYQAST